MPSRRTQLLWILGVVAVMAAYLGMPINGCPRDCGPDPQLLEYTRLPGVPRKEAEKMLAWGRSFPCRLCGKRRYLTLHRYTQAFFHRMW